MNLFSGTISQLEQGLAYSSLNQKVIANNVANVDTPGYKSKDVNFERMLQDEIQMTSSSFQPSNPKHFEITPKQSTSGVHQRSFSVRENGNGVDMDREMANLATNQIYYDALIERLSGKFGSLNSVIQGG
ncbi:flagellar basal body rod protein FlgB [Jeotgalibacillus marinus]|uniref:Flagellar basal body rod protein FlgB n=1 Tax=Jeotgalibacillus marinus TaxID=86667 RepID=A0ABV3Q251_9BACL